jgi:hypothetical protein
MRQRTQQREYQNLATLVPTQFCHQSTSHAVLSQGRPTLNELLSAARGAEQSEVRGSPRCVAPPTRPATQAVRCSPRCDISASQARASTLTYPPPSLCTSQRRQSCDAAPDEMCPKWGPRCSPMCDAVRGETRFARQTKASTRPAMQSEARRPGGATP